MLLTILKLFADSRRNNDFININYQPQNARSVFDKHYGHFESSEAAIDQLLEKTSETTPSDMEGCLYCLEGTSDAYHLIKDGKDNDLLSLAKFLNKIDDKELCRFLTHKQKITIEDVDQKKVLVNESMFCSLFCSLIKKTNMNVNPDIDNAFSEILEKLFTSQSIEASKKNDLIQELHNKVGDTYVLPPENIKNTIEKYQTAYKTISKQNGHGLDPVLGLVVEFSDQVKFDKLEEKPIRDLANNMNDLVANHYPEFNKKVIDEFKNLPNKGITR